DRAVPVSELPGFAEGRVSVQDAGAQLAAPLLDAHPGMRVLDACAAPGGKTLHLLEHTSGLADLLAIDVAPERLLRIEQNLQRSRRTAHLAAMDARALAAGGPATSGPAMGELAAAVRAAGPFDRILVDAPCSATGVIRRHPDIKLLRRAGDIESCAAGQLDILRAAFRVLAPHGRLLYCTCSVLPAENDECIAAFLLLEPQARPAITAAVTLTPGARERPIGAQLLPGSEAGTDGFYYACLEKTTAGN
ncbi:MAG: 16S rRNA (cytosine(967)-C(5))-methyltransferase RsmB, partial [Steroidobacteraceae bacterium]